LRTLPETTFRLEFYEDQNGNQPVRQWLRAELTAEDRRSVGAALWTILQHQGIQVCGTDFGRQLGEGLFEFRLREPPLFARVFCHAHGRRLILLLGGYDKGRDPSARRQKREIALARARMADWRAHNRR
jgi:phage-related protein